MKDKCDFVSQLTIKKNFTTFLGRPPNAAISLEVWLFFKYLLNIIGAIPKEFLIHIKR